jgi:hypothetical protein|tara:strand:- start:646 stop:1152 length:507 start_codon:yes stop_codon:yes gene_type:complete
MICYKIKPNKFLLIFLIVIVLPNSFAHLDAGEDKLIDDYLIDFGYSPENPKAIDKVTIAFNLLDDTTKEIIVPTSVWIRISSSKEVVFAGTFHPEAEHVAFTYTFPYSDDYEITARFKDNNSILAETDFEIKLEKEKMSKINLYLLLTSLVLFILIGFIIIKLKTKKW